MNKLMIHFQKLDGKEIKSKSYLNFFVATSFQCLSAGIQPETVMRIKDDLWEPKGSFECLW